MELTVYRQRIKNRNGVTVYDGEDAHPYMDEQLFLVADGLGGGSSIRHQKIRPEMFEEDKILDVLFEGVFEKYDDERFVKYVKESFFELFAVKDNYTLIYNIKRSGYFASRCVAAIVLHEMIYNPKYSANELFARIGSADTEEGKANVIDEISKHFKSLIQNKLRHIAKNANLIYETSLSGLALLGSTLCAAIYLESDDSVEVIYLTAGDSRAYAWQEACGLRQVLADEKRKDDGMTNYIRANQDSDFYIRANYMKFSKPCILFNASDGCYGSDSFVSQMAFEKQLLDSVVASDSMESLSNALTEFFVDHGRHDDSSTISLKAFGFESYDDLKKACAHRLSVLNEEYISQMEGLLDYDYKVEYEECKLKFPSQISVFKDRFYAEPVVVEYCDKHITEAAQTSALRSVTAINREISCLKEDIDRIRLSIAGVIVDNFVKFRPFADANDKKQTLMGAIITNAAESKIEKAEEKHTRTANDYVAALQKYRTDFEQAVATLSGVLEEISKIEAPASFEDYDEIAFEFVERCERDLDGLFAFFKGIKNKKLDIVKRLTQQRQEYIKCNQKLAEKYPNEVEALCEKVVSREIDCNDVGIFADDRGEILCGLDKIAEAKNKIAQLEESAKTQAHTKAREEFWDKEHTKIITKIVAESDASENAEMKIDKDLLADVKAVFDEHNAAMAVILEKRELQTAIFAKYDEIYNQYIGG